MQTVKEILHVKGHEVWSISPYVTMFEALKRMAEKEVGALVVIDGGRAVGIVTERDYARKLVLHGKSSKDTNIKEIMATKLYSVKLEDPVDHCVKLMVAKHVRHLLVYDGAKLTGILSLKDLAKTLIPGGENWASPSVMDT
ncbi:MAG: CBS domain-containing protein [Syntrophorhabdaceae bacterium]|jgi:CBS domain-containing protein|nr:CBS domain-containing protein [Syntrophorhabdaceae bacterium]MDD5244889.1 CBS domain-containing protein [Syntrophorhabdaceae bacterium]